MWVITRQTLRTRGGWKWIVLAVTGNYRGACLPIQTEHLHLLILTSPFLKSIFVRTVRWCRGCSGLALLPRGAFGIVSGPCISFRSAYNWNGNINTLWRAVKADDMRAVIVLKWFMHEETLFTEPIIVSCKNSCGYSAKRIFNKLQHIKTSY